MQIIKVSNLTKTYKTRTEKNILKALFSPKFKYFTAVENVSFEIQKGECVAFLGPNGAGKTTTTKMLTGLIYPTNGQVEVLGYKPQDRNYDFLRKIGLVMGNKAGLNWDLTPDQSFELLAEIYNIDKATLNERLSDLFEVLFQDKTKLEKLQKTQIRKLSLGERMKMELISSILHKPEVLILDEPTIGLDITSKKNIREFIRKLNKETETTVILTSHDMDDIEKVCDRVMVINNGKIVYDGQIEKLKESSSDNLEDIIEKIYLENQS